MNSTTSRFSRGCDDTTATTRVYYSILPWTDLEVRTTQSKFYSLSPDVINNGEVRVVHNLDNGLIMNNLTM